MSSDSMYWTIVDGDGNLVTDGVSDEKLREAAKSCATQLRAPVYAFASDREYAEGAPGRKFVPWYRITASYERDGQLIDCSQAEVTGGERYASRREAEEAAADMQDDLHTTDLDPTTTYSVEIASAS